MVFNPDLIKSVLSDLRPDNLLCLHNSKTNEGKTDKVEPIYSTPYATTKLKDAEWSVDMDKYVTISIFAYLHAPSLLLSLTP